MTFTSQQKATLTKMQMQMIELGYMTTSLSLTIEGRKMIADVLFVLNQDAIAKEVAKNFATLETMREQRRVGAI